MSKKQTAVQMIYDRIASIDYAHDSETAWQRFKDVMKSENFLELEKQQIVDAFSDGNIEGYNEGQYNAIPDFKDAEQYYNKTYKQ